MRHECPHCGGSFSALKNHIRLTDGQGHGPTGTYPDDTEDDSQESEPNSFEDPIGFDAPEDDLGSINTEDLSTPEVQDDPSSSSLDEQSVNSNHQSEENQPTTVPVASEAKTADEASSGNGWLWGLTGLAAYAYLKAQNEDRLSRRNRSHRY